jgi:restriction endonuclease S subunit
MTSKSPYEKYSQENFQIMFQICVLDQKLQARNQHYVPIFFFLNAIIKKIKIQNIFEIFEIIEISKCMEPNKCIH